MFGTSWEFVNSLDFEWSFIRGRKRFNWPMVSSSQCSIVILTDVYNRFLTFLVVIRHLEQSSEGELMGIHERLKLVLKYYQSNLR